MKKTKHFVGMVLQDPKGSLCKVEGVVSKGIVSVSRLGTHESVEGTYCGWGNPTQMATVSLADWKEVPGVAFQLMSDPQDPTSTERLPYPRLESEEEFMLVVRQAESLLLGICSYLKDRPSVGVSVEEQSKICGDMGTLAENALTEKGSTAGSARIALAAMFCRHNFDRFLDYIEGLKSRN